MHDGMTPPLTHHHSQPHPHHHPHHLNGHTHVSMGTPPQSMHYPHPEMDLRNRYNINSKVIDDMQNVSLNYIKNEPMAPYFLSHGTGMDMQHPMTTIS